MDCEYCKKTFVSKSNLSTHQKTTKYCLEIQGKTSNGFKCEYCNKIYTQSQALDTHIKICSEKKKIFIKQKEVESAVTIKKLESEISKLKRAEKESLQKKDSYYQEKLKEKDAYYQEKLKEKDTYYQKDVKVLEDKVLDKQEYIAKLEARLDKFETTVVTLAAEPKTTTTKTTTNVVVNNNTLNLSKEHVTKVLEEHFTKEVAAGGQKRLAEMVYEKMLKGSDGKSSYVCVDPSRQTFEFTNNDGDVERDVKAKKLTKALINSDIQKKAAEVGNQIWTKADGHVDSTLYDYCSPKVMELACFERDDSKFRSELSALTS
jgi:hypothetical protein